MIILPVGVDYQANRFPVVTFWLMGINVVIFAGQAVAFFSGGFDHIVMNFGLVPANHGWWAWITSMFLHGGPFHLLGNMVYLFLFGSCVEDILGRAKFLAFYLGGGLVANLIQVVFSTDLSSDIPIIGASGAISACIGAFLVVLPKTGINFRYLIFWFWTGEFWLKSWIVITVWFLMDFVSFVIDLNNPTEGGGVAFGAHVGGMLGGLFAMWLMRPRSESADATRPSIGAGVVRVAARIPEDDPAGTLPVYISIDGNQTGPFPPSAVRGMLQLGSIPATAYFWSEALNEWRPVAEL